jgi:hypothetical protein
MKKMLAQSAPSLSLAERVELLPKAPTLHAQWVRCGAPGCHCATGDGHGPYHYLFFREGGRLRKCYVRLADVEAVRAACATRRARERRVRDILARGWSEWRAIAAEVRKGERHD